MSSAAVMIGTLRIDNHESERLNICCVQNIFLMFYFEFVSKQKQENYSRTV